MGLEILTAFTAKIVNQFGFMKNSFQLYVLHVVF